MGEYKYGTRSMIILAAAVSDFHIPFEERSEHKISSTEELTLHFSKVKKVVKDLKNASIKSYLVTFKLETEINAMHEKAKSSLMS